MLIELSGICKSFTVYKKLPGHLLKREKQEIRALKDVSFGIEKGEIVGYLGPNGAGKSTTIKLMSGILAPDAGRLIIDGREPHKQRVEHVRHIGVVFGQRSSLWWDVPVLDSFQLLKDIYKIPDEVYKRSLRTVTELMELGEIIRTPARQLSLGQRMRCEIAAALLHEPDILFLDEPTIGLDAVSKLAVRDFIHAINRERQVTVILTTHDMQDVEALTSRVMVLGHGSLLYDGTLNAIKERYTAGKTLTARYGGKATGLPLEGATLLNVEGDTATYAFDAHMVTARALMERLSTAEDLRDVSVTDPPLEEIMAAMYKELAL